MWSTAARQLIATGRLVGAAAELSLPNSFGGPARCFAAAPKQTLEQYVDGIRAEITDAYEDLVLKHDAYKQKFATLVKTSGVPSSGDFNAVVDWTNKTAAIFKEVNYPERVWQLSPEKVNAIKEKLKAIPAEKKDRAASKSDDPAPWYLDLTDSQLQQVGKNPRIFRELEKLHSFEEKLQSQIEKDAKDRGVPVLGLKDLPAKVDLESEYTLSSDEAKWCVDTANAKAADMSKNDPMIKDPYSTPLFKDLLKQNAEKYGIPADKADSIWSTESKTLGYA